MRHLHSVSLGEDRTRDGLGGADIASSREKHTKSGGGACGTHSLLALQCNILCVHCGHACSHKKSNLTFSQYLSRHHIEAQRECDTDLHSEREG